MYLGLKVKIQLSSPIFRARGALPLSIPWLTLESSLHNLEPSPKLLQHVLEVTVVLILKFCLVCVLLHPTQVS